MNTPISYIPMLKQYRIIASASSTLMSFMGDLSESLRIMYLQICIHDKKSNLVPNEVATL